MNARSFIHVFLLTSLSLLAFAANSVLCRLALGENVIDATGFTVIRLFSGALVLCVLLLMKTRSQLDLRSAGSWKGSIYLALYATAFSYAYVSVDTATGALVLFATVQLTMLLLGVLQGNRLSLIEGGGVALAFTGLLYLLLPNVQTPSLLGFLLMVVSGIAWGLYSLNGRNSANPLLDTAGNFIRTLPLMLLLAVVLWSQLNVSAYGFWLAVYSGALASALGYSLWYRVLPLLRSTQAAVIQLLVPPIATAGGVIFVGESLSMRLIIASVLTLGGILIVMLKPAVNKAA